MENNISKILNSIYQNASNGNQSLYLILCEIKDRDLYSLLKSYKNEYFSIMEQCKTFAHKYELKLKDNNFFEKSRMWMGVKMNLITDKSNRHIAEMLMLGSVMGLSSAYKDYWDNKIEDEEINKLIKQLLDINETLFIKIKDYLKTNI